MVGVRGSKSGVSAAAAREQAGREGYKFIDVKLMDTRYDGVQGFEVLQASAHIDHITNTTTYAFSVTGGPLRFERDPNRNGLYHHLIDTPYNREKLRGVNGAGILEIVDKAVEAEVLSGETPAPKMSKDEYFAALNADRAAKGLPPVGGETETVGAGEAAVDTPVITPTVPVPPAVPNTTTGRGRPAAKAAAPLGSPLVQITEE